MIKSGELVKFISAADINTFGWNPERRDSVGIVVGVEQVGGKPWYNIVFSVDTDPVRVFHKDVEVLDV